MRGIRLIPTIDCVCRRVCVFWRRVVFVLATPVPTADYVSYAGGGAPSSRPVVAKVESALYPGGGIASATEYLPRRSALLAGVQYFGDAGYRPRDQFYRQSIVRRI